MSLDGKVYSSNASIQFAGQFDRPQYGTGNTINYQNSQIKLEIFSKKNPSPYLINWKRNNPNNQRIQSTINCRGD